MKSDHVAAILSSMQVAMAPAATRHLNGTRVGEIIDLIAQGDEQVQFEIFRRLGLAASFIISRSQSTGLSFETFKLGLSPSDAEAMGKRARLIGFGIGRADSPLDEMAFMLVAASLFARAGAGWIDKKHEHLIDRMVRAGENLVGSSRPPGGAEAPGSSSATGA